MDSDISTRLVEARKRSGKSQREVCDALFIDKVQTLSAYENRKNDPSIDRFRSLLECYNVSADWVLFGKDSRDKSYKSNAERVEALIDLIDALQLSIEPEYGFNGEPTGRYLINLSGSCRSGFPELFDAVYKYRNLYNERNLSEDDYKTLVVSKINKTAEASNDFEYVDPPEPPSMQEQIDQWIANEELPF